MTVACTLCRPNSTVAKGGNIRIPIMCEMYRVFSLPKA